MVQRFVCDLHSVLHNQLKVDTIMDFFTFDCIYSGMSIQVKVTLLLSQLEKQY